MQHKRHGSVGSAHMTTVHDVPPFASFWRGRECAPGAGRFDFAGPFGFTAGRGAASAHG